MPRQLPPCHKDNLREPKAPYLLLEEMPQLEFLVLGCQQFLSSEHYGVFYGVTSAVLRATEIQHK